MRTTRFLFDTLPTIERMKENHNIEADLVGRERLLGLWLLGKIASRVRLGSLGVNCRRLTRRFSPALGLLHWTRASPRESRPHRRDVRRRYSRCATLPRNSPSALLPAVGTRCPCASKVVERVLCPKPSGYQSPGRMFCGEVASVASTNLSLAWAPRASSGYGGNSLRPWRILVAFPRLGVSSFSRRAKRFVDRETRFMKFLS